MIHEKGLCKVLSAAYKGGGYSVIPVRRQVETVARSWRRNEIILNGATWPTYGRASLKSCGTDHPSW